MSALHRMKIRFPRSRPSGIPRGGLAIAVLACAVATIVVGIVGRPIWNPYWVSLTGGRTVEEAITALTDARGRIVKATEDAGLDYPPAEVVLVAYKNERRLEIWGRASAAGELANSATPPSIATITAPQTVLPAATDEFPWICIGHRSILAASGGPGPKLREGDRQVPEGVYAIIGLNPNSAYHLSMKLDYPNADDRVRAAADGRDDPGSNIFIHGRDRSIGCLAMGDPVIEELFVLVHDVGVDATKVVIAPHDPRAASLVPPSDAPAWTAERYANIEAAIDRLTGVPR
ncbi:MAG: murein L,D-transpeptidase family protein [Phycisphaerales bacterium]